MKTAMELQLHQQNFKEVPSGAPSPSQAAVSLLAGKGRYFPGIGTALSTLSTQALSRTFRPVRSLSKDPVAVQITTPVTHYPTAAHSSIPPGFPVGL